MSSGRGTEAPRCERRDDHLTASTRSSEALARRARAARARRGRAATSGSRRSSRWRASRACRSSASMRRRSIVRRAAACIRASSPSSSRRASTAWQELVAAAAPEPALLVVLDGIEDPHNIGAVLRSVDAAGAHGVVRQARHAAPLDGVAMKASAGAAATVRIATVVNIARAVEELKEAGRLDRRPGRRRARALRRGRPDRADGDRARGGGERAPAAGAGALRPAGVDPDAGGGSAA